MAVPNSDADEADLTAAIAAALDRWTARLGRQFGPLSRPQRRVLRALADREAAGAPARVGDVAADASLTAAGATRMLDALESLGYIRRFRRPGSDQRQVYVTLSPIGTEALAAADAAYAERVRASIATLPTEEVATLARLLARIAALPSKPAAIAGMAQRDQPLTE